MLKVNLSENYGIATLVPVDQLTVEDFKNASGVIDPFLEKSGSLTGLLVVTEDFPGWESFAAAIQHFKFVKSHHKKIEKVALVTDSKFGDFVEKLSAHFVKAEVKHFDFSDRVNAEHWLMQ